MVSMSARERDQLRGTKIGMVMQRLHLISAMTIRANLQLAQRLVGNSVDNPLIERLAEAVGIVGKLDRYPRQLSQGEAQRAAIARALVNKPALLLADEPTSALDDNNCEAAIRLLLDQAALHGATLIVATHDDRIKSRFAHIVLLGAA
jgi:putative ABC transport system ATP-binding protein